jgi:hypothetical protein
VPSARFGARFGDPCRDRTPICRHFLRGHQKPPLARVPETVCVQSVPRLLRAWMEPFMELSCRECALTRLAFLADGVETGPRLLRVVRLRFGFNGRRLSRRRVAVAVNLDERSQDGAGAPIAYSAGEVGLVPRLGAARGGCCSRLGFARTAPARTSRRARSTSLDSATNSSLRIRPAHWSRRASSLCGVGSAGWARDDVLAYRNGVRL